MTWSLNEVESAARKAAHGAGLAWGVAEEAGKVARWLCSAGWPGAESLAAHLSEIDGVSWDELRPVSTEGTWQARKGPLSPLAAGAALSDRANVWAGGATATLGPVAHPILLIPFMYWAAELGRSRLSIDWPGVRVTHGNGGTCARIDTPDALTIAQTERVTVGPAEAEAGAPVTRGYRADLPEDAARILTELGHRTYAPETDQSRRAGAGADGRDSL